MTTTTAIIERSQVEELPYLTQQSSSGEETPSVTTLEFSNAQSMHSDVVNSSTAPSASSLEAGDGVRSRPPSWLRRSAYYLLSELRAIARLQWLIMTIAALIVLPWTYRSWRLAQWTAKLNYLQQCEKTVVCEHLFAWYVKRYN